MSIKMEMEGELEGLLDRLPQNIALEATNSCNLHCAACPSANLMRRRKGLLSQQTFQLLLSQIDWPIKKLPRPGRWPAGADLIREIMNHKPAVR